MIEVDGTKYKFAKTTTNLAAAALLASASQLSVSAADEAALASMQFDRQNSATQIAATSNIIEKKRK